MGVSNKGIANLLNDHFSTVGEKLAMEFLASSQENSRSNLITNVTPMIMQITLSESTISQSLRSLKPEKASGPDKVTPKLLKYAEDTLIPSLLPIYVSSSPRFTKSNCVPRLWKTANVTPLFNNDDESDKQNYRLISLLNVLGKFMEASVTSTINIHIIENHLSNQRQWAYRKGHSTELMLIKMTENWRKALDGHQVVGVVFIDFKKAFDSISHSVLLHKLQGLGISGDLWFSIADYLTDRTQVTVINGCQSNLESVKYGVP